jgi:hypothetical protein
MSMSVSETQLKDMVKAAMAETLVEQRALLRDIIEEVIEDIALSRAIDEGMKTTVVSRDEVFAALDSE